MGKLHPNPEVPKSRWSLWSSVILEQKHFRIGVAYTEHHVTERPLRLDFSKQLLKAFKTVCRAADQGSL